MKGFICCPMLKRCTLIVLTVFVQLLELSQLTFGQRIDLTTYKSTFQNETELQHRIHAVY